MHTAGDLALLEPGDLVQRTQARLAVLALVRVIGPVLLLAATPAFIVVGIAWGAVYAQWVEPRLHLVDWLSGLCFALLPLCVALVIVLPVLDGAATDLGPLGPACGDQRGAPPWVLRSRPGCHLSTSTRPIAGSFAAQHAGKSGAQRVASDVLISD